MTQNASDVEIANQGFAAFRQDLNDVLEDITTLHSGTAAPSTTYANQWWYETDTDKLYIRNEDNDAWIEILTLDQANDHLATIGASITLDGTGNVSIDSGDFTVDTDTLFVDASADSVGIGTSSPNGKLHVTDSTDIAMSNDADGQIVIEGNGYSGAIALNATGMQIYQNSNARNIIFGNNETEQMRIDSSGNVGIGTTSLQSSSGFSTLSLNGTTGGQIAFQTGGTSESFIYSDASDFYFYNSNAGNIKFYTSGTQRVNISSAGGVNIAASSGNGYLSVPQAYTGTTSSAVNMHILSSGVFLRSVSSGRYKTGIEDAEMSYAEELYNLRPVYYKSLGTFDNPNHGHWGFIAEEVAEIDPRLCLFKTTEPDLDEDGNNQYDDDGNLLETTLDDPIVEGVQYDRMIPLLLMLLKAEKDKVETLETKVATLETAKADFETRIAALESA